MAWSGQRKDTPSTRRGTRSSAGLPTATAEKPTKWRLRKQFTCLQDLAHTESTNEALPIGLSQAKFPGTAGRPGARDLLRVPIGAAYVFCGISSTLHIQASVVSAAI